MADWELSSCPTEALSGRKVLCVMVLPALAPEGPEVARWLLPLLVLRQAGAIPLMLPVLPTNGERPGVANEVLAAGLRLQGVATARAIPGIDGGAMPYVQAAHAGDVLVMENLCQYQAGRRLEPTLGRQVAGMADYALCDDGELWQWLAGYVPLAHSRPLPGTGWPGPVLAIVAGTRVSEQALLLPRVSLVADQVVLGGAPAVELERARAGLPGQDLMQPHRHHELLAWYEAAQRNGLPVLLPVDYRYEELADPPDGPQALPAQTPLDLGPKTLAKVLESLDSARTVIWTGPLGLNAGPLAMTSSEQLLRALTRARWHGKTTVAAGEETMTMIRHFRQLDGFQHVLPSPMQALLPSRPTHKVA